MKQDTYVLRICDAAKKYSAYASNFWISNS